ncbi:COP9 signalosome complex subunit 3-like protein [Elsinoe fawcettii]|nr:COP9 signalosome complex subunit 3-like protein [Elsinoe fawcettii]
MVDLDNLLVAKVARTLDESDEHYDERLRTYVSQLQKATSTKSGKRISDPELLRVLHPAENTLGYIFLLNGLTSERSSDLYVISLVAFLTQFDPIQARYAGAEWRRILQIANEVVQARQDTQLLTPVRNAILRMDPSSSTFTTNHFEYVQLCLHARRPREALPILDKDILYFPYKDIQDIDSRPACAEHQNSCGYITRRSEISGDVTTLMVQEYYLLAAQAYIGVRNYERAKVLLELVIATPTLNQAVDLYMLEAFKKLILVGLVADGAPVSCSHLFEQGSLRLVEPIAKPYQALADAFKNRDLAKYHAEVDVAGSPWADDGNLGLVNEAAEALRRHRVLDLQRTYAALPVDQVAIHLSLSSQNTAQLLQTMIQQGHLQASISTSSQASHAQNGASSGGNAVLRFHSWDTSRPVQHIRANPTEQIQAQIQRIAILSEAVKEADRKFSLTKDYGDWLKRNKKGQDAGAAAFEDPMEMDDNFGGGGEDEDIMAT